MIEKEKVENVLKRLAEVERLLGEPGAAADQRKYRELMREHASLRRLQERAEAYYGLLDVIEADRPLAADESGDPELREMAAAELAESEAALPAAEKALSLALLPPDPDEHRNAILEIRAGTGGDEAALFAGDLFRMYSRYAETKGWKTSLADSAPSELGGYKEISFTVEGDGAYKALRHEGGGHRVQRVPETEAQGRIHTSAATVAVFPEAEPEDDLVIRPEDLRIDTYRSGGAGGQHVNKTDSAVRITHLPTGIVVQSDEERSQHQNKEKCMSVLRSKILAAQRDAEAAKMGAERKGMIGSGDRSERIRTYNFPQNRLTDHRINLTLYSLDRIMEGLMDELLDALAARSEDIRLEAELARIAGGDGGGAAPSAQAAR
ncbi:MAG: peptide chain release factor 1 [Kiritimatiellae bacterium]|nr:peptide chain release factor 1 [Kiritimatiellia bacterium]